VSPIRAQGRFARHLEPARRPACTECRGCSDKPGPLRSTQHRKLMLRQPRSSSLYCSARRHFGSAVPCAPPLETRAGTTRSRNRPAAAKDRRRAVAAPFSRPAARHRHRRGQRQRRRGRPGGSRQRWQCGRRRRGRRSGRCCGRQGGRRPASRAC
jgi:hypothetical protein